MKNLIFILLIYLPLKSFGQIKLDSVVTYSVTNAGRMDSFAIEMSTYTYFDDFNIEIEEFVKKGVFKWEDVALKRQFYIDSDTLKTNRLDSFSEIDNKWINLKLDSFRKTSDTSHIVNFSNQLYKSYTYNSLGDLLISALRYKNYNHYHLIDSFWYNELNDSMKQIVYKRYLWSIDGIKLYEKSETYRNSNITYGSKIDSIAHFNEKSEFIFYEKHHYNRKLKYELKQKFWLFDGTYYNNDSIISFFNRKGLVDSVLEYGVNMPQLRTRKRSKRIYFYNEKTEIGKELYFSYDGGKTWRLSKKFEYNTDENPMTFWSSPLLIGLFFKNNILCFNWS